MAASRCASAVKRSLHARSRSVKWSNRALLDGVDGVRSASARVRACSTSYGLPFWLSHCYGVRWYDRDVLRCDRPAYSSAFTRRNSGAVRSLSEPALKGRLSCECSAIVPCSARNRLRPPLAELPIPYWRKRKPPHRLPALWDGGGASRRVLQQTPTIGVNARRAYAMTRSTPAIWQP